jgi:hypothetical protein
MILTVYFHYSENTFHNEGKDRGMELERDEADCPEID